MTPCHFLALRLGGVSALVAVVLSGCLSAPDAAPSECKVTSDCDVANGEVCDEGVCYGNPPAGPFAALITPPSERKNDVVARELRLDSLPADGLFADLALDEPVTFNGSIVCPGVCTSTSLDASIVVTRPSSFVGGPAFRQVFTSDPRTGAFSIAVPRVRPGEAPYEITVVPAERDQPGQDTGLAELVPPLRTILNLDNSQSGKTLDLGGDSTLTTVSGTVVDQLDNPATNYRVVALGRWEMGAPLTEVSSVDFIGQTGGSAFSIQLSEGLVGPIEIVARPFGTNTLRPTLALTVTPTGTISANHKLVIPDLGSELPVTILVTGTASGGEVAGVLGAHVTVTGAIDTGSAFTSATFSIEGDTDASGMVAFHVPGGDFKSTYKVSVVPPANSTVGMVFQQPLSAPSLTKIKLADRLAISGTVLDVNGNPLKDVQVTTRPSLRFAWSLPPDAQTFFGGIPAATAVTNETGGFVVFVDPSLENGTDDVFGFYDLQIDPTVTTNAPSFLAFDVEVPRDSSASQLALPPITLPDAAHIHGRIVDPFGEQIEGAELKLFRIEDATMFASFCAGLPNAPASCPIPALLLGRGVSDENGIARLTLPRL